MVTLRIGSGVAPPGAGAACGGGDAVADGDGVWSDEDVFDEQFQDSGAAFGGGDGLGVGVELGEEAFQVVGQGEVGVAVGELGVEGVDLVGQVGQVGFAGTQVRARGRAACRS